MIVNPHVVDIYTS